MCVCECIPYIYDVYMHLLRVVVTKDCVWRREHFFKTAKPNDTVIADNSPTQHSVLHFAGAPFDSRRVLASQSPFTKHSHLVRQQARLESAARLSDVLEHDECENTRADGCEQPFCFHLYSKLKIDRREFL